MKQVMQKAQELAEAISASDIYRRMKTLEDRLQEDPEASAAVGRVMEARKRVEDLLMKKGMDPEKLKEANLDMAQAEQEMSANPKVEELRKARKDFTMMMDSVNRVLRVVITGEIREEDFSGGSCSGDCSSCGGCG